MKIKIKYKSGDEKEYNNVTRLSILDFDNKKEIEFVTKEQQFYTTTHIIENADKVVLELVLSDFKERDEMVELDKETKAILNKNIWNLYDNNS